MSGKFINLAIVCGLVASGDVSSAATIFRTTDLVAQTPVAAAQLPPAIEFTLPPSAAGRYIVTLSDASVPTPLESLSAIVTLGTQVLARVAVTSGQSSATAIIDGTPGAYRIHVLGTAAAGEAGGAFAVSVVPEAGGAAVIDAIDSVAADESADAATSVLQATFDIADGGSYELTLSDHAFPVPLSAAPAVLLTRRTASGPVEVTRAAGPFTAVAGTHDLLVIASAGGADEAGLYSVQVSGGPSSATVSQSINTVGRMSAATPLTFPAAGQYALTMSDAGFPAPLSAFGAAIVQGSALLGQRTGAGSAVITAAQGAAQLFTFATSATVGAFTIRVAQGATTVHADVRAVDASAEPDTPAIYFFTPSQPVNGGAHVLTLHDFRFPSELASIDALLTQGDTIAARADHSGEFDATLQPASVKALVAVTALPGTPAQPNSGLFGIDLSTAAGANVFESTGGVGGLFRSHLVQIPAAGRYDFAVSDLEFPAALSGSSLAITRGTELVAQVLGETRISRQLAAGTFVLNFIGQPATGGTYGTYGLEVADSPPLPTVTLGANSTSVTSGQVVTLQWTSTNATSCTASNGWSGAKSANGTEQSAALTANTTFALSCSGPGGTANATAAVAVTQPTANSGGGGGGGSFGPQWLLGMILLAFAARYPRGVRHH